MVASTDTVVVFGPPWAEARNWTMSVLESMATSLESIETAISLDVNSRAPRSSSLH